MIIKIGQRKYINLEKLEFFLLEYDFDFEDEMGSVFFKGYSSFKVHSRSEPTICVYLKMFDLYDKEPIEREKILFYYVVCFEKKIDDAISRGDKFLDLSNIKIEKNITEDVL